MMNGRSFKHFFLQTALLLYIYFSLCLFFIFFINMYYTFADFCGFIYSGYF